jgi:hypothetical protein
MTTTTHSLSDLEQKVSTSGVLTTAEVARVLACPDLVAIGVLGETARTRASGTVVTFGRVAVWPLGGAEPEVGAAGELRIVGTPASIDAARAAVKDAAAHAGAAVVTGFSLVDLLVLCGHDHLVLADALASLRALGLTAVAEVPVDRFSSTEELVEALRAVRHAGLGAPRVTVDRANLPERLALIDRVVAAQDATGMVRAFAPLPRLDAVETPSTGYDDVKTVAAARLRCPASIVVQVDWPLYGPKLAQVALAYGAGDVDGVAPIDASPLGPRRAPVEEISRQIAAAGGVPVQRDGQFAIRG